MGRRRAQLAGVRAHVQPPEPRPAPASTTAPNWPLLLPSHPAGSPETKDVRLCPSTQPHDLGPGRVGPVGPAALPGRASTESYILQLIMPVLCVTQSIHNPLYMAWAVMMLSPAYELICHCGMAVLATRPTQPSKAMEKPSSCRPELAISALRKDWGRRAGASAIKQTNLEGKPHKRQLEWSYKSPKESKKVLVD